MGGRYYQTKDIPKMLERSRSERGLYQEMLSQMSIDNSFRNRLIKLIERLNERIKELEVMQ